MPLLSSHDAVAMKTLPPPSVALANVNDQDLRLTAAAAATKSTTKEFLVGAINKPPLSKISVSSLSPNNYLISSNLLTTKDAGASASIPAAPPPVVAAPLLKTGVVASGSVVGEDQIITSAKTGASANDPNLDSMISLAGLKAKVGSSACHIYLLVDYAVRGSVLINARKLLTM